MERNLSAYSGVFLLTKKDRFFRNGDKGDLEGRVYANSGELISYPRREMMEEDLDEGPLNLHTSPPSIISYLNSEDRVLPRLLLQLVDEKEYSLAARMHEKEWEERRLASRLNRAAEALDEEDDTWKLPRRIRSYPSPGSPRAPATECCIFQFDRHVPPNVW